MGWDISFSAKTFGDFYTQQIGGVEYNILRGVRLVYAKKSYSYSGNQLIVSGVSILADSGIDKFNTPNGCPEDQLDGYAGYTTIYFNSNNKTNGGYLLEKPPEVLRNLVKTEIAPSSSEFELVKLSKSLRDNQGINFSLSLNEVDESRKILENMCLQSRMMFRYRARDRTPIVETISNKYYADSVLKTIDPDDLLSFSFSKTKYEDLCIGGCIVKYAKNYSTGSLSKETHAREFDEEYLNIYKEHYSISDEKNHILEVEAPYIQDEASALELRDYLFELNKNQHLTCKFKLSIKDGIELEVGDIIDFSKDPLNTKPYGNSIIQYSSKLDQTVYPYFMITSVSKKASEITIEVYQLHELNTSQLEVTTLGDITLDGQVNYHDRDLLVNYIQGNVELSEQQLLNANINQDFVIDNMDVISMLELEYYDEAPEQAIINNVFEQLRQRLHPVLELNTELDTFSTYINSFIVNIADDPVIFSGANSFVDEEPYSEISLEISKYKFTVIKESTSEVVQEFEDSDIFEWDVSELDTESIYKIKMVVEAEAVEYGYYGETRTLVSDDSDFISFYISESIGGEDSSVLIPILNINGEDEILNAYPLQELSFSAENSFFEFADGTVDEEGGEITNYHFHCVYLYNNTNEQGFLTSGNILFSTSQDSPLLQTSSLQSVGRYMCFLWMQSPSGVQYDTSSPLPSRGSIVFIDVTSGEQSDNDSSEAR